MASRFGALTQVRGMGPLPDIVLAEHGEQVLAALFRRHDLPVTAVEHKDLRIPLIDMVDLFESAARLSGDPFLGLRVGQLMRPSDYGPYLQHAAAADTLAGGIRRAIRGLRYYQAAGSLRLQLRGDEAHFTYRQHVASAESGRQHADHVLPTVLSFVRGFLGEDWLPNRYLVPYPRHGQHGRLEECLGGAVAFGQDGVGIAFSRSLLSMRATAVEAADRPDWQDLRDLVRRRPSDSLGSALADVLAVRLLDGQVDLAGAAARLRLSPRTLQRQLAAEGGSYRAILEDVRFASARRLLVETRLTAGEIAFRLGYAEHPHFPRAFGRRSGCSPTDFRHRIRGTG